MKKIIVCMFAVAAIALTSCGNKASVESVENDAQSAVTELKEKLEANDTEGFNAIVSKTQETIESLIKEGKVDEAKDYAESLKSFIDENAETIKNVVGSDDAVSTIVDAINDIPTGLQGTADEVKEDLEDAAKKVGDDVKEAFEDLKDEAIAERDKYKIQAEEAAQKAVEDAKQKASDAANQAVEDAKQKASDAANKAVDDAANKLKNAFKK